MPAFAGMTNVSASFRRHSGESRNPEQHSKTNYLILNEYNFKLLKADPSHPSLHFKKIGQYRAVRIGLHYRALAIAVPEGLLWFWIGSHAEYDKILS